MLRKKFVYVYSRALQKVIRVKNKKIAEEIADEGSPEYKVNCPKCNCLFGVN
jgi:hypothetical protein